MRIGVCCSLDQAETALRRGADYVELGAVGFKGLEPTWDPEPYRDLPVEVANLFFPGEMRLFGPERTDPSVVADYVSRTLERAASVGVKLMVIGSGQFRKCPAPGSAVSTANARFVEIVGQIQAEARQFGIVIAPESLNRTETNVGNDLGWMARALVEVGAGYTADSYHVLYEWDANMREGDRGREWPSPSYLAEQLPHSPSHVHFGDLARLYPKSNDPMMCAFCSRLEKLSYNGHVSLECQWDDMDRELPLAIGEASRMLDGVFLNKLSLFQA